MTRVLEEKIQDNTPGSSKCMSVSEALVRSLCAKALKDERVALALLKLVISSPQAAKSNDEQVFEEDEEGVLARFVERELRQRALREAAAKDTNAGMGEERSRRLMMSLTSQALQAASRSNLPTFVERVFAALEPGTPFVPNWHYEHICWALERVRRGEPLRLIINVPPRSGKSIIATVAWPLFLLGHDPAKRVICVSHTEDLARKFSVDRRFVAQQPWYQRLFPAMRLTGPKPRDLELITTARGGCLATGVGGGILGRGCRRDRRR